MNRMKYIEIIIIVLVLSIAIISGYLLFGSNKEEIVFYLIGDKQIFIEAGFQYEEPGFVATNSKNEDLSQYVRIDNFVNSQQAGTYIVKYTLIKDDYKKEIIRNVVVIKKNDNYNLILNGDKEEKLLLGGTYIDKGCILYDENNNYVNASIEVKGEVNNNKVGVYKLVYSVYYNNSYYEISRNVEVYDLECEFVKELKDNKVNLVFHVNSKYFESVKLPNGSISTNNSFSYMVSLNGVYNFEIYDIYGNKKIKTIEVNEIINDLKCEGVVNRYGTNLNIVGLDKDKFSNFEWTINGIKYSGNNSYNISYKKISIASVVAKNDKQSFNMNCTIKNNLYYDFKYDPNNQKPVMKCNTYTENDRINLEEKLKNVILEAGYGTRAGVVEAARFLVGALDYKIPYLGPKSVNSVLGRYDKIGLNIANSNGWGCSVSGWTQGIDCTNFIRWAFIQAGLKVGYIYSTSNVYKLIDVVDQVRVGDLLLTPKNDSFSHVGIIIGIDDENIYVAESTTGKINALVVTTMKKNNLPKSGTLSMVKLYKYENNGNITAMWVS